MFLPCSPCFLVLAAGLVMLGSCANPRADQALHARTAMIGMPKQTLLSCAGVPERTAAVDNIEYFTYSSSRIISYPSAPAWGPYWGPYWGGPAWYGGTDVRSYDCEATFTLRNGVVERITYGGASSGAGRLDQCYAVVENCLSRIAVQSTPAASPVRQGNAAGQGDTPGLIGGEPGPHSGR